MKFTLYLDGSVKNKDANYDETFWEEAAVTSEPGFASVTIRTKKLDFHVASSMKYVVVRGGHKLNIPGQAIRSVKYAANVFHVQAASGTETVLYKIVSNVTSRD